MNLSRIFIIRPVATSILVLAVVLFGLIAFRTLPVNDLPNVDFPTIQVTATLRGANPEVMASTVATPLERQFSRIAGVDTMSSNSTNGAARVTLQFSLDRDIDSAAQDVQTAISQAMRFLPADMEPPYLRKVNPADAPILFIAVTAQTLPMTKLDEFADNNIAQRLSMVSGVAQVSVFGSQKYAVRVYLDPEALSKRGLGLDKVVSAIQNANSNLPAGVLSGVARNYTVKSSGKLERAESFKDLIVAYASFFGVAVLGVLVWFVSVRVDQERDGAVGAAVTPGFLARQFRARTDMSPAERLAFRDEQSLEARATRFFKYLGIAMVLVGLGGFGVYQL